MNENTNPNDVWYYAKDGTTFGPFTSSELLQKAGSGEVTSQTLIVPQGQEEWRSLATVFPSVSSPQAKDASSQVPKEKKPLSKRDKILGYGCLLPLMAFAVFAFLSDFINGDERADENAALLASDIDDNTPKTYELKDAKYLVFMGQKLKDEAERLMADEDWKQPESAISVNPVKTWKLRTKGIHDEVFTLYGYKASQRNENTVRHLILEALQGMSQAMVCYEELVSSRTVEAKSAARELMQSHMDSSRALLTRAEQALQNGSL